MRELSAMTRVRATDALKVLSLSAALLAVSDASGQSSVSHNNSSHSNSSHSDSSHSDSSHSDFATQIYAADKPLVKTLWSRSADLSDTLRSVEAVELSDNGQYLVTGSKFGYDLMMWRTLDAALLWKTKHNSEIECVAFSPGGKWVAAGDEDFELRVYEADSGRLHQVLLHDGAIDGMAWSNDGHTVATGTETGKIYIWNAADWSLRRKVDAEAVVNSLQFSKDDTQLVVGGDTQNHKGDKGGFIRIYDTSSWRPLRDFPPMSKPNKSARFSPDETMVVAASFDQTVKVYDVATTTLLARLPQDQRAEAAVFHPSGHWLLSGGIYRDIDVYDTKTWEKIASIDSPNTEYIDISASGRLMVTGHERSGLISVHLFETDPNISSRFTKSVLKNKDLRNSQ